MTTSPDIRVFEVGPRDGLQNESIILPVDQKVALIEKLVATGLRDVEIGSFVHPKWVPQMAATDQVAQQINREEGVRYWALVPNLKGLERAIESGQTHVAVFMSSSETHNQKNINRSIAESLEGLEAVIAHATSKGCDRIWLPLRRSSRLRSGDRDRGEAARVWCVSSLAR